MSKTDIVSDSSLIVSDSNETGMPMEEFNEPTLINPDDNGEYTVSEPGIYAINQESGRILCMDYVEFDAKKTENDVMLLSIYYNKEASNTSVKVKSPSGQIFIDSDYSKDIYYNGLSSFVWKFENAESGKYWVTIEGDNIDDYFIFIR